jgi:hypothetical protein
MFGDKWRLSFWTDCLVAAGRGDLLQNDDEVSIKAIDEIQI